MTYNNRAWQNKALALLTQPLLLVITVPEDKDTLQCSKN